MIIPAGHRVLVKAEKIEEKTKGGIILPQETQEREQLATTRGELIAIGDKAWLDFADGEPWAKVGDTVIFAKYGGLDIKEDEVMYRLLNDEDIIAVIK